LDTIVYTEHLAERFAVLGKPNVLVNGHMGPDEVQRLCVLDWDKYHLLVVTIKTAKSALYNLESTPNSGTRSLSA
jgi:hypothetical protein